MKVVGPAKASGRVAFREIVEAEAWEGFLGQLPLMIGERDDGRMLVADLTMLHNLLVAGIGGSVLYAVKRGARATTAPANRYFTSSLLFGAALSVVATVGLFLFEDPLLRFFGGAAIWWAIPAAEALVAAVVVAGRR